MISVLLLAAGVGSMQSTADQDLASRFRSDCMTCHVAPDIRFAEDRSWLEQIRDTA